MKPHRTPIAGAFRRVLCSLLFVAAIAAITDALAAVQEQAAFSLVSAVSRLVHGSAGTFDIDLPLSGEPGVECRSNNGKYTLVFTFSSDVGDGKADVTSGTGAVQGRPQFSGTTMTVNLAGVGDVQQIIVTLHNVTSTTFEVLPDTPVSMNILVGDTTGDKTVGQFDLSETKHELGMPVTADNFRNDVKVNGMITATDVRVVRSDVGHTLP